MGDGNTTMLANISTANIVSMPITIMASMAIANIVKRLEWERIIVNELN